MLRLAVLSFCLALCAVSGQQRLTCLTGWFSFAESCYGYGEEAVTWFDAASACVAHGGKLVEIETSAENNFVKSLARSKGNTVWIGANDLFREGTMRWASGSTSHIIFSDYSSGQPDNYKGSEDCLCLWDRRSYRWNDFPCTHKYRFICEARLRR